MKPLLLAFQFLTIIPIRVTGDVSERDIAGSSAYFPMVGFLEGIVLAAISYGSSHILPPAVIPAVIIAIYLLINGAFHQDGLSDTFDALAIKSTGDPGHDRQRRLAVMRDPTSGPAGITAIAVFLLLKYLLLKEALQIPFHGLNPAVTLMPLVSAWSMTMMMAGAKSARGDGLGRIFLGRVGTRHIVLASALLVALAGITYCGYIFNPSAVRSIVIFSLTAAFASLFAGYALRVLFTSRFGGLTGDNLGCIHEVSEIAVLIAAVITLKTP
jgi:adenosylcobinamide-GDP ribazoletransferase